MKDKKKLAGVLIALNLAFIWGNSLITGTDSGNMSGSIMAWLNSFLSLEEAGAEMLHHLIRKAAHFTEFACLGALLCWRCCLDSQKHAMAFPALLGMAAAVVDESIQMFTPDRGPSLTDVWIDTSGAAAGILLLLLGHHLTKRIRNQ